VALQGTLDTFALPEVLRLLASTKKTGRLRIESARGAGDVWVADGAIVALDSPSDADGSVEQMFELLRSNHGTFTFDAEVVHPQPEVAVDVEPLLAEAEALLAEWRLIESVVPSLSSWVALAPELPAKEVSIDRGRWRSITAIAAGSTVGDLGAQLQLTEVPVSRLVKELVELGLAAVSPDADDAAPEPAAPAPVSKVKVAPQPAPEPGVETEPATVAPAEPAAEGSTLPPAPWAVDGSAEGDTVTGNTEDFESIFPGLATRGNSASTGADASDDVGADEIARQLANLSPKAAKAVKAAAAATTDEERDAALAAVGDGDGDEPLNRGLLLKFLSSVRT
jgi:hypothetical protein